MSKHNKLSDKEQQIYSPSKDLKSFINNYSLNHRKSIKEIKILDWGCGRGKLVGYLRKKGIEAYGVDNDVTPLNNCASSLKNIKDTNILSLISSDNKTQFPDNYFDLIISDQVIEHIEKLNSVLAEMNRITKINGSGLHIFPSSKHLIEAHLKMPLVHWMPKNIIRKLVINFFVFLRIDPHWSENKKLSLNDRVESYYNYSINKTFYRSYKEINKLFFSKGFECNYYEPKDYLFKPLIIKLKKYFTSTKIITKKIR